MNAKEQLAQELVHELEEAPALLILQVLNFLRFLKTQQTEEAIENQEDLKDALIALEEVKTEGTVSWESLKSEVGL